VKTKELTTLYSEPKRWSQVGLFKTGVTVSPYIDTCLVYEGMIICKFSFYLVGRGDWQRW